MAIKYVVTCDADDLAKDFEKECEYMGITPEDLFCTVICDAVRSKRRRDAAALIPEIKEPDDMMISVEKA